MSSSFVVLPAPSERPPRSLRNRSSSRRSPTPNRPKPAHGLPRDPCRLVEAIGGGGTVTPPRAQLRVAGIAERDQVALVIAPALRTRHKVVVLQILSDPARGRILKIIRTRCSSVLSEDDFALVLKGPEPKPRG